MKYGDTIYDMTIMLNNIDLIYLNHI